MQGARSTTLHNRGHKENIKQNKVSVLLAVRKPGRCTVRDRAFIAPVHERVSKSD